MLTTEELTELKEYVLSEVTQSLYRDDRLARWLEEAVARLPVRHSTDQRLDRLSEETASLSAAVGQLAESHRRAEARLDRLEAAVAALAEAQGRTEERVGRLEEAVERLAEAQTRTEARVEELAEAQRRTEERLASLTERVDRLTDVVGRLRGDVFELKYRDKVEVYFGPLLRRVEVVRKRKLEDALETKLTHEELLDVLRLDLIVGGQPRRWEPRRDALVAAEVSAVIDRNDVDRARRRTELLRKAGFDAIPAVAGEDLTRGAEELAAQHHVAVVLDGSTSGWEEALQSWLLAS
jgi:chaperonin cofactor prefoldin